MITLKNINLSSIDLSGIDLRGIKLGLGGRGGGSGDGFPQLPGDVTRWHFGGLTNEMMAAMDDPRLEDADHKGRFLSFKNFAWGGMSGVGGYEMNFNSWTNNVPSIPDISMSTTTTSVSVSVGNSTYNNNLIYIHMNNWDINKNHWLKVTSTYEDGDLAFIFYNDKNTKKIGLPANGYVNILAYPEFKGSYMYISTTSNKQGSFTIEQLPLYPGALVFDGVDDYGTCDNFPILNKEKGYTVVALRKWLTPETKTINEALLGNFKNNPIWISANLGAFQFEIKYNVSKKVQTNSFGIGNNITLNNNHLFSYQISNSYNGSILRLGSNVGGNFFTVGCGGDQFYANAAIWELVFLDHDATEEELTKIKDYFVKTYPWLFPDQAWTVTGKTNEDEDRATIANITGNGNDLVLSNFGFAEGSGYGLYAYNFNSFDLRDNVVKPTDVKKDSFRIIGIGDNGNVLVLSNTSNSAAWKIRITGMKEGDSCIVGNANKSGDYIKIIKDGIYTFQKQYAATSINGIWYNSSQEVDVLVEQIPEYEGYLVTDGVDDKIVSSSFEMGKDFTIVGDWKFINNKKSGTGLVKGSSFYIYNTMIGLDLYINSGSVTNSLDGIKSINAACSDGRAYDRNWNEILANTGNVVGSGGMLEVSSSGGRFDRIAFKNLAIYPRILSKNDCIKAYNYLQTLKAK